MKFFTLRTFLIVAIAALACQVNAQESGNWEAIVDEDFSLFTKGSEQTPDSTVYAQNYKSGDYYITESIFHQTGWSGFGIYMAGGCASLSNETVGGGYINTPEGNYNGRIRVSFRYKAVSAAESSQVIFFAVCTNGILNPLDPGSGTAQVNAEPGDDWQTASYIFVNPSNTTDCFVQLNAAQYQKGVLIDDIKVERDKDYLSAPSGLSHTNFSLDGFTATWKPVANADKYLVTVEQETSTGSGSVEYSEGFEGLVGENGIVTDVSGVQGVSFGGDSLQFVTEGVPEGNKAIGLNDSHQYFILEGNGGLIKKFTFQVAVTAAPEESVQGSFYIDGWDGNEWEPHVGSFRMNGSEVGKWEVIDTEEEDSAAIKWSGKKSFEDRYTKYRFSMTSATNITLSFDDFNIVSGSPTQIVKIADNVEVAGDNYTYDQIADADVKTYSVTDFDPYAEYYVTVKACHGDAVSESSSRYHVFDITAPVAKEASDVDERGAFTANWTAVPKATKYELNVVETYVVPEDKNNYVIFDEDFTKAKGTGTDYDYWYNWTAYSSLDDVADNKGWTGSGTMTGDGEVGCMEGYSEYSMLWDMTSPYMSLDNNDGVYEVTVTATAPSADDYLVVQGMGSYDFITLPANEKVTATVTLTNGQKYDNLYLWTYNNGAFVIDRITVTQNLKKGDKLNSIYKTVEVDGSETSYRVSGIDLRDNYYYGYNVMAYREQGANSTNSSYSNDMMVDFDGSGTGIDQVNAEKSQRSKVFNLQGLQVTSGYKGVIIKNGRKYLNK